MAKADFIKIKTFTGTWRGRAGTSTTYHIDHSEYGKRIVVHVWKDAPGAATVRAIKGDFWKRPDEAITYAEETVGVESVAGAVSRLRQVIVNG